MKVLVTSGATREPIDSVRFISNLSSGRTGAAICDALAARGFEVTQLHGTGSMLAATAARHEPFTDHGSLDAALRRLLADGGCHAVVHAAAVSDYAPAEPACGAKLASDQELVIRLRPLPKIIDRLRAYAGNAQLTLVGFKLTHDAFEAARVRAARRLLRRSGADYVVHNDVETLPLDGEHVYTIHARDGTIADRCTGRTALAAALARLLWPRQREERP